MYTWYPNKLITSLALFAACNTGLIPCTWQCGWEDKCYSTLNGLVRLRASKARAFIIKVFLWQGTCYFSLVIGQFLFQSWAWEQIFFLNPQTQNTPAPSDTVVNGDVVSHYTGSHLERRAMGYWTRGDCGLQFSSRGEVGVDAKMGQALSWAPGSLWSPRSKVSLIPTEEGQPVWEVTDVGTG